MSAQISASIHAPKGLPVQNPVYSEYFADPFVFRANNVYYAVGTGPSLSDKTAFPMLQSIDFVHWERIDDALIRPNTYGDHYWAPEVAYHEGSYYLYYSVGEGDQAHTLRLAVSDAPQGPYRDIGKYLLDREKVPFAIDAHPFRDDDGAWYLYYARDFLDCDETCRAGTALVVAPLIDMTELGPEQVVMRATHDWQLFHANRFIYGQTFDWHTLEGPCVVKHEGRYYCLYSGGNWQTDNYGLDFAVADSPLGPFVDTNKGSYARVLRSVPGKVIGPGHNSLVIGPDGHTSYIAYHAWDPEMVARRMFLDPLVWTNDGPSCIGPSVGGRLVDET